MPKHGLIHDYDLMANAEDSARGVTCAVCDTQHTSFQWSDYSGEGMCRTCGCTYQLKWGGEEMEKEGKYPYMTLREDFVPIAREYWNTTKKWVHYGSSISRNDGHPEMMKWMKTHYPDFLKQQEKDTGTSPTSEAAVE